jgi:hypothetical protein
MGIHPHALRRDPLPVDLHPALRYQRLTGTPTAKTRHSEHLLESNALGLLIVQG